LTLPTDRPPNPSLSEILFEDAAFVAIVKGIMIDARAGPAGTRSIRGARASSEQESGHPEKS
jgi:hypothetical protein